MKKSDHTKKRPEGKTWSLKDIQSRMQSYFEKSDAIEQAYRILIRYADMKAAGIDYACQTPAGSCITIISDRSHSIPASQDARNIRLIAHREKKIKYMYQVEKALGCLEPDQQLLLHRIFCENLKKTSIDKLHKDLRSSSLLASSLLSFAASCSILSYSRQDLDRDTAGHARWQTVIEQQKEEILTEVSGMMDRREYYLRTHASLFDSMPAISRHHSNSALLSDIYAASRTGRSLQKLLLLALYWYQNPHLEAESVFACQRQIGQGAPFLQTFLVWMQKNLDTL